MRAAAAFSLAFGSLCAITLTHTHTHTDTRIHNEQANVRRRCNGMVYVKHINIIHGLNNTHKQINRMY